MRILNLNFLSFKRDDLLYLLSMLTLLFVYLPTDVINVPPYRVSEILVIAQFLLLFSNSRTKLVSVTGTYFVVYTYFLICLCTLLLSLNFIPSNELSFAFHLFLYSCLPLLQFLVLINIRISNISLFYKMLTFTVFVAVFFVLYAQSTSLSGVSEIASQRLSTDYLSLENEYKQSLDNTGIINYLGNTNGRSYNISFLLICFGELLPFKSFDRFIPKILISLFLLGFSLVSLSRGALLVNIIYFVYVLYTFFSLSLQKRRLPKYIFFILFCALPLLPMGIDTFFTNSLFSDSLFFLDHKSDASGRFQLFSDLWSSTNNLLIFGRGYLYSHFNDVTLGVGQSTWLEILLSTGLISLLGYFSFLWVMVSSACYSAEYRGFAVFAILFVLLVGMSVHYLDKIPRLMLTFSIIFGVLTSYLKSRSTMIHP